MKQHLQKVLLIAAFEITSNLTYSQTPTGVSSNPYPAFTTPEVRNVANSAFIIGGGTKFLKQVMLLFSGMAELPLV